MPDIGVRKTETGLRRVSEDASVRVTETFNRAQASLLGTSALTLSFTVTTVIRDLLTTPSFTFTGTTMTDSLVPDVNPTAKATLKVAASNREFKVRI